MTLRGWAFGAALAIAPLALAPLAEAAESCTPFEAFQPILSEDVRSIPGGAAPALPEGTRIGEVTFRRLPIFDFV